MFQNTDGKYSQQKSMSTLQALQKHPRWKYLQSQLGKMAEIEYI